MIYEILQGFVFLFLIENLPDLIVAVSEHFDTKDLSAKKISLCHPFDKFDSVNGKLSLILDFNITFNRVFPILVLHLAGLDESD